MSTLTLCCDDLYDKEKVDIETLHLDDVYRLLQSSSAGLTDQEAVRRTEIFGPNKLEENHRSAFMHFISFFINRKCLAPILPFSLSPFASINH